MTSLLKGIINDLMGDDSFLPPTPKGQNHAQTALLAPTWPEGDRMMPKQLPCFLMATETRH